MISQDHRPNITLKKENLKPEPHIITVFLGFSENAFMKKLQN